MGFTVSSTLSLIFFLIGSFDMVCEGIDMFNSVFGSMTWVRGYGSTTPWSVLVHTWGLLSPVP